MSKYVLLAQWIALLLLTLCTLKSVWIFSLLLFIYFRRCWQGEFVHQSNVSFFGDHFPHSHDRNMSFRGGIKKKHVFFSFGPDCHQLLGSNQPLRSKLPKLSIYLYFSFVWKKKRRLLLFQPTVHSYCVFRHQIFKHRVNEVARLQHRRLIDTYMGDVFWPLSECFIC